MKANTILAYVQNVKCKMRFMKYKLKKAFLASKVVTESSWCFHFSDDRVTGVGWKVEEAPLVAAEAHDICVFTTAHSTRFRSNLIFQME